MINQMCKLTSSSLQEGMPTLLPPCVEVTKTAEKQAISSQSDSKEVEECILCCIHRKSYVCRFKKEGPKIEYFVVKKETQ